VTLWLTAAAVLLLGLIPCLIVAVRGEAIDGVVALAAAGVVVTLALLLLAVGFGRSIYGDVAVVAAVVSFSGGLVFVQYLERWG
jgi:multisubunit Na+/H+ antiporter MnhF subunit